jgi:CRP-like cAMP-binding protein
VFWKAGDPPSYSFLLSKGEVEFFSCKEAEMKEFNTTLTIGSFFGEIDSLINDKPLTTNLKAITDCEIYEIDKNDMVSFLRNNPGLLLLLGKAKFIP